MITAIILAHNDEKIIERVIKSVQFCDEVIVIDDESADETVKLAEKAGARTFSRVLEDDFAGQRNFGLEKASGDWVLFVDSDEVVSPKLEEEIKEVISSRFPTSPSKSFRNEGLHGIGTVHDNIGYYLRRRDFIFGKWLRYGETANVRLLRLARKDAGKWVRPVHEVWWVNGETGLLANPLLHYPHQTVRDFLAEINDYSTKNAKYLFCEQVRTNWGQIVFWPLGKFVQNYFLRGGFLDGVPGFMVAMMMSMHSFLTRGKLYILRRDERE